MAYSASGVGGVQGVKINTIEYGRARVYNSQEDFITGNSRKGDVVNGVTYINGARPGVGMVVQIGARVYDVVRDSGGGVRGEERLPGASSQENQCGRDAPNCKRRAWIS